MAFKKPQVTEVKTDIQSLSIYLRSVKKFGKTTLFRDLVLEKFGDPKRGLLVGVGAEVGYSILDNLNATQIEDWDEAVDLKNWLIEEKGKEHNIEMVAFDVVGELMPMAEDEIVRLSTKETGKVCKSFNSAFGGYGEPRKRLLKLLKEYFVDLKKSGIMPFAIAHTKVKSIKEKGDDSEGYNTLTSDLSNDCEGIFGDIFDCVLTGYIDRSVENGKTTNEVRKLYLRGNGFVDAGCRFSNDAVPEYIVFDKPNMAKEFIETLEEGLRKSRTTNISKDKFKTEQKKEQAELSSKAQEKQKEVELNKKNEDEKAIKEEKLDQIKSNMAKLDFEKLTPIMATYNVSSFEDANTIPMECLDEILKLIQ
jgi:hypothetical protein|uniref:AAA domain protein n=1 Tax=Siphoviridae sp. cteLh2 TaxID=2825590 RepID=A0A8S5U5P3_9CAUD|nr:AAA family ATPase [uncultured Lachnoclostridium sp.]DAF89778.1 MAG TPA: AAA domain protein [Siphoviridae sp. cteLh2]